MYGKRYAGYSERVERTLVRAVCVCAGICVMLRSSTDSVVAERGRASERGHVKSLVRG